jgi:hypothetical protein
MQKQESDPSMVKSNKRYKKISYQFNIIKSKTLHLKAGITTYTKRVVRSVVKVIKCPNCIVRLLATTKNRLDN